MLLKITNGLQVLLLTALSQQPETLVDFLVVGGGVVGLAIAQRLTKAYPKKLTCLVERHSRNGEETSSRNSEVIHSGLYYPPDSLKTRLCLRGRDLLYAHCKSHDIPHKQTGKLVVARRDQVDYIQKLYHKSKGFQSSSYFRQIDPSSKVVLPTELISGHEARQMEPELSEDIVAALWCPKTGILDSHTFMQSLEKDISESGSGEIVQGTTVVRIDKHDKPATTRHSPSEVVRECGWVVQLSSNGTNDAVFARTLINASGLSSPLVLNSILDPEHRLPMFFARGSYASYHGPGIANIKHLIYPCPHTGPNAHAFESLGTHLTLDLQGKVRFGPDIEWMDPSQDILDGDESDVDFWTRHLTPDESRMVQMHKAVTEYLPNVIPGGFRPDYVGIRPKLIPPDGGFQDFVVRIDHCTPEAARDRVNPMISLLGIESPGLTSSLAIAEEVVDKYVVAFGNQV
ncbi:hypothetical protein CVT24_001985 [Panaeolus cyanescens]|uniref:L-2-hydroxyglutarate dehydrogenase, mitochondrial n=1 Tax=Panaeolus cyanescens TaxID=181874 RepID=A0A409YHF2_9AGAR|nr:hypothetical protein CVT24_001985 [Panaeolus cyanescens]